MIEVDQSIDADKTFAVGMGADLDASAASASADLESRAMIRERIGPFFIDERDRDQEPVDRFAVGARLYVIRISNPFQIELIPVMVGRVARISFVFVLDGIAERIDGLRELPRECLAPVFRVGNDGRIGMGALRRSVGTDEAILAAD